MMLCGSFGAKHYDDASLILFKVPAPLAGGAAAAAPVAHDAAAAGAAAPPAPPGLRRTQTIVGLPE